MITMMVVMVMITMMRINKNSFIYYSITNEKNTHGFDNEGKDYNGFGKLVDWWQPETEAAFEEKVQCVVNQYDQFEVTHSIFLSLS